MSQTSPSPNSDEDGHRLYTNALTEEEHLKSEACHGDLGRRERRRSKHPSDLQAAYEKSLTRDRNLFVKRDVNHDAVAGDVMSTQSPVLLQFGASFTTGAHKRGAASQGQLRRVHGQSDVVSDSNEVVDDSEKRRILKYEYEESCGNRSRVADESCGISSRTVTKPRGDLCRVEDAAAHQRQLPVGSTYGQLTTTSQLFTSYYVKRA